MCVQEALSKVPSILYLFASTEKHSKKREREKWKIGRNIHQCIGYNELCTRLRSVTLLHWWQVVFLESRWIAINTPKIVFSRSKFSSCVELNIWSSACGCVILSKHPPFISFCIERRRRVTFRKGEIGKKYTALHCTYSTSHAVWFMAFFFVVKRRPTRASWLFFRPFHSGYFNLHLQIGPLK